MKHPTLDEALKRGAGMATLVQLSSGEIKQLGNITKADASAEIAVLQAQAAADQAMADLLSAFMSDVSGAFQGYDLDRVLAGIQLELGEDSAEALAAHWLRLSDIKRALLIRAVMDAVAW